jgi:hypothetical protein
MQRLAPWQDSFKNLGPNDSHFFVPDLFCVNPKKTQVIVVGTENRGG